MDADVRCAHGDIHVDLDSGPPCRNDEMMTAVGRSNEGVGTGEKMFALRGEPSAIGCRVERQSALKRFFAERQGVHRRDA